MVWHYNAFLSYDVEPVEESRVWLDAEAAIQAQVDLNAYFLANGTPVEDSAIEQAKLAGQLYVNAMLAHEKDAEQGSTLDRRA